MDIIINDLAGQYAIQTENDATDTFLGRRHRRAANLATGHNTDRRRSSAAFWGCRRPGVRRAPKATAASSPRCRTEDARPGRAAVRPGQPAERPVGRVHRRSTTGRAPPGRSRGVPIYVTAGLADNKILVLSTAAAEVYEDRGSAPCRSSSLPCSASRSPTPATSRRWSSTPPGSSRSPRRHERALGRPQPAGSRARPGRGKRRRAGTSAARPGAHPTSTR